MKGFFTIIAAALLFFTIQVLPCAGAGTIRVGIQVPLTGKLKTVGRDIDRGIRLVAGQINGQGGIGDKQIELFTCDDQNTALKAVICAKDLSNKDVLAVIGSPGRDCSLSAKETYCRKNILQIGRGEAQSSAPDYCHTFLGLPGGIESLAAFAATFMVNVKSYQNIVLISDRAAAEKKHTDSVETQIGKLGGSVNLKEFIDPAALTCLPLLKKIELLNPDVIYFSGKVHDAAPMKILIHQLGIKSDFLFKCHGDPAEFHQIAGNYAQKAYCITMTSPESLPYDLTADFIYDFKSAYHMETPAIQALTYIDGARALFHLLKETAVAEPWTLADQLRSFNNFPGISGPVCFAEPISQIGNSYSAWKYNEDGTLEIVYPRFEETAVSLKDTFLDMETVPVPPRMGNPALKMETPVLFP